MALPECETPGSSQSTPASWDEIIKRHREHVNALIRVSNCPVASFFLLWALTMITVLLVCHYFGKSSEVSQQPAEVVTSFVTASTTHVLDCVATASAPMQTVTTTVTAPTVVNSAEYQTTTFANGAWLVQFTPWWNERTTITCTTTWDEGRPIPTART